MEFINSIIENQVLLDVLKVAARIIIIILIAAIVSKLGNKAIARFFKNGGNAAESINNNRKQTLTKLSQNILYYVVYFFAMITILEIFISITPLLTGVGVLGLAVGFGAQEFVKDIVTGFFILFEGQYDVGDRVQINGVDGVVKEVGIRTTKIEGENGEICFISNGSILQVVNLSKKNSD